MQKLAENERLIDITSINLIDFIKAVYGMSVPVGLGHLHFTDDPLTTEEAKRYIQEPNYSKVIVDMDYVKGRCCKMTIWEEDGKRYTSKAWYDHTDTQLRDLLKLFDIDLWSNSEHGVACHCDDCRKKRGEV